MLPLLARGQVTPVAALSASPSGGGGGSSYTAKAVHFDGNASLGIATLAAPDSGLLSYSGWRKFDDLSEGRYIWNLDPDNNVNDFHVSTDGKLFLQLATSDFASYVGWTSAAPLIVDDAYHHFLLCVDVNQSAGNKVAILYIDDILVPITLAEGGTHAAFVAAWTPNLSLFGGTAYGNLVGDAADEWFAPGVSLRSGSTIPEATRRLFLSATNKPVNPSGFPASAVLFSGNSSTFATNQGTGGAFTLTGTLTNASTSPSD